MRTRLLNQAQAMLFYRTTSAKAVGLSSASKYLHAARRSSSSLALSKDDCLTGRKSFFFLDGKDYLFKDQAKSVGEKIGKFLNNLSCKPFSFKEEKRLAESTDSILINENHLALSPSKKFFLTSQLPVLQAIIDLAKHDLSFKPDFKDFVFVCGQHLLSTTIDLFKALIELGAKPKNIFVVGKNYSNNEHVILKLKELGINVQPNSEQLTLGGFESTYNADITAMWENCYRLIEIKSKEKENVAGIIVLDDGGHVSANMPAKVKYFHKAEKNQSSNIIDVVCIEQTSSGMTATKRLPFPTIEVATSALKKWIEPSLVARKCVKEIQSSLKRVQLKYPEVNFVDQPTFGIVGLGKIGDAILEQLITAGYKRFIVFDKNEEKAITLSSELSRKNLGITIEPVDLLWALFNNADIIVGCTGYDITASKGMNIFRTVKSAKMLVSCSSKDTEFKALLEHIQEKNRKFSKEPCQPLEDIRYKNGFDAPIILARGGTPIGFTNEPDSVEHRGIETVRGLKLMACLQAYHMLINKRLESENYMVNPVWQRFIIRKWLASKPQVPYSNDLPSKGESLEQIKKDSDLGGTIYSIEQPDLEKQSNVTLR